MSAQTVTNRAGISTTMLRGEFLAEMPGVLTFGRA
jgi:hypothetical protein